jgi:hypothetical protein
MDGRYGLTEEITKAHQRQLLVEASCERAARQAMFVSTSVWRRVLRADMRGVIEELLTRHRESARPHQFAERIPISAS